MNRFQFLLLLVGVVTAQTSNYTFTVLPSSSYINVNGSYLTQASPQACYADCLNCQIQTNVCEDCYQPYFQKTSTGTCLLSANYKVTTILLSSKAHQMNYDKGQPSSSQEKAGPTTK